METPQPWINSAAALLGKIDSGARDIFLETVNTDNQVEAKVFGDSVFGVFHSAVAYERFWISIAFETDTERYNGELAELVESSLKKSGFASCMIWIWNDNRKIIEFLKERFHIQPDCGPYYYASIEFITRRAGFDRPDGYAGLDVHPYDEGCIDDYLSLLDGSMTFASPPPRYIEHKARYQQLFAELTECQSFEAFWKGGALVGLYWRKDAEIDVLAVADDKQRQGYGSAILTRAIEMVFEHTTKDYAYLYAVDWNTKGQSFYKKYGMEQNGHSYLLRLSGPAAI